MHNSKDIRGGRVQIFFVFLIVWKVVVFLVLFHISLTIIDRLEYERTPTARTMHRHVSKLSISPKVKLPCSSVEITFWIHVHILA
jgi:hypothetical protein